MSGVAGTFLLFSLLSCQGGQGETPDFRDRPEVPRTVAVTIDDLPVAGQTVARQNDLGERQRITRDLLEKVTRFDIPGVGFVNERKLYDPDLEPDEVALLEAWLDAGQELANHTYSHYRFEDTPLDTVKNDVLRGEEVTRELMEERGMELRYFRHPFLNIGDDQEKTAAFNEFLADHDYIIAPVSVSSRDWYYNIAYVNALRGDDETLADRIADDYVRYTLESFSHSEQVMQNVLGREPAQIFLLHANRLNADHFDRFAEAILERGYDFITLDEALEDELYGMSGVYNDPSTLRALEEVWEEQTGDTLPEQPSVPEWVEELAGPYPP